MVTQDMVTRYLTQRWWILLALGWVMLYGSVVRAEPLAWVVERGNHRLVLLGSIHYGRADFYPLPAHIQAEFAAADALAVELDITAVDPAQSLQLIMTLGLLPPTVSLPEVLGPTVYRQLDQWCLRTGIPCGGFERLQPWVIALQIMETALAKSGLKSELGVEQVLLASRQDQRLIELETLEQQLRLFAELDFPTQSVLLAQTLADYGDSTNYMNALATGWLVGDEAALEALLLAPLERHPEAGAKLMDALLYRRNKLMAAAAEQMLGQYRRGFFLVGVGHLVGRDSVLEHLRRRGFNVSALKIVKPSAEVAAALD